MTATNEARVQEWLLKYQQRIFALVWTVIGGDKNVAYEITVASFVAVTEAARPGEKEDRFFCQLIRSALTRSQSALVIPSKGEMNFPELTPAKQKSLQLTQQALRALPFESRAVLVLRDQMHLPYHQIAVIQKVSPQAVRIQVAQARGQLRSKLEEALRTIH